MSGFIQQFGEPYWIDRDDVETILFYEFPDREWQVEFDEGERFKRMLLTSESLMANAEQRAAYGVTKTWPPAARANG